ncbi:MAG: CpXC domain-containing protein [Chloroflexales bacterium]
MPISYQKQAEFTCPNCGANVTAAVWQILDAQEQPGVVDDLRRGLLNRVTCPHCGGDGPVRGPLLFHDAQARRVIFAGAPGTADHEVRDQARNLHALLVSAIPEEQRRPYLADVDIAQDVDGVALMLKRMDRRRGGSPPAPSAEAIISALPDLAIQALMQTQSGADLRVAVGAYPLLLRPEVDGLLAKQIDQALDAGHDRQASALESRREALSELRAAAASPRGT